MREQKTLWALLILNVVLSGGFLAYLFLSAGQHQSPALATSADGRRGGSSLPVGFAEVGSESYTNYLNKLREAGCPEERVRQIVLSDVEDYFAHKRLELALSFDVEWWHEEPMDGAVEFLRQRGEDMDEQRRALVKALLGESENERGGLWKSIQLTGAELGSLPTSLHQQVQEICARSMEEQEALAWSHAYEKQPIPTVDLARLRDQARTELRKILTHEQMEEFLLRFSHNAQELRVELRAFEPTADEFRKIFRALDPLEQQLQQQYGEVEALSKSQQERYYRQREEAIREALGNERFQAYLASRNRLSLR